MNRPVLLGDAERRRQERKGLRGSAQMGLPNGQVLVVRTLDISAAGLGVVATLNVPAKTNCIVRLALPVKPLGSSTIDVHGCVTHSFFSTDEDGFKLGLQFTNVPTATAQAIKQFLQS